MIFVIFFNMEQTIIVLFIILIVDYV